MENASKALIIAGAILLAILIIGIGMLVLQSTQGNVDEAISQMTSTEIDMYNQKFANYEGTKVKGSNVKSLIGSIISNNGSNDGVDGKIVSIAGDKKIDAKSGDLKSNEMSNYRAEINTGATYTVTLQYNSKTNLVETVTIQKNS